MKLSYRTQINAAAISKIWNKPLEKFDWFEIKAQAEDESEIMVYDYIGWPFNDAGELVRAVAALRGKKITVRINSPGGDIFDAMAIYNAFSGHDAKVTTRGEALAASAASIILLAGKEVQAYQNNMIMIHDPWLFMAGNRFDLRAAAEILDKISDNMVDIYAQRSKVDKKELRGMLKDETWMTAKEAKEKGFIDTILDGKAAKAAFDLSMFANVPDELMPESDNGGKILTRKETERALRNAGASRDYARAVAAKGAKAGDDECVNEICGLLRNSITILGR